MNGKGTWIELDSKIEQGIILLKREKENPAGKLFFEFMFSGEAQAILRKYGYVVD